MDELVAGLRNTTGRGSGHLHKIADRFEEFPELVHILDEAGFAIAVQRYGRHGVTDATQGFYFGGEVLLRRSRGGTQILRDFAHEVTHALDFASGGVFSGVDIVSMSQLQIPRRELRAFHAEALVDGFRDHGGGDSLVDFIIRLYGARRPF